MDSSKEESRTSASSVSAVVPTLNEERNLPFLLGTLRWCDEIVIVDQGSRDRTREIAEEFGCKVVTVVWQPVFDACRAIGVDNASGEWILTLDADEMIPAPLATTLRRLSRDPDIDVVSIPRLNYFLGPYKAGGFWPDPQPRFFRRGELEIRAELHSTYDTGSARVVSLPHTEGNAIHHFPYRGAGPLLEKLNAYTDLEIRKPPSGRGVLFQLIGEPLKIFVARYFRHGAVRHGVRGLWLSAYWSLYGFMTALKRWEAKRLEAALADEEETRHEILWSCDEARSRGGSA